MDSEKTAKHTNNPKLCTPRKPQNNYRDVKIYQFSVVQSLDWLDQGRVGGGGWGWGGTWGMIQQLNTERLQTAISITNRVTESWYWMPVNCDGVKSGRTNQSLNHNLQSSWSHIKLCQRRSVRKIKVEWTCMVETRKKELQAVNNACKASF